MKGWRFGALLLVSATCVAWLLSEAADADPAARGRRKEVRIRFEHERDAWRWGPRAARDRGARRREDLPTEFEGYLYLAERAFARGDYTLAHAHARAAVVLDPDHVHAAAILRAANWLSGVKSGQALDTVVEKTLATEIARIGLAALKRGKVHEAIELARLAWLVAPYGSKSALQLFDLARTRMRRKYYDRMRALKDDWDETALEARLRLESR